MSRFDALLTGLRFRTATPAYSAGEELEVIVTGRDGEDALVRIGDTVLRVHDPDGSAALDDEVRILVTDFDAENATGEAELL